MVHKHVCVLYMYITYMVHVCTYNVYPCTCKCVYVHVLEQVSLCREYNVNYVVYLINNSTCDSYMYMFVYTCYSEEEKILHFKHFVLQMCLIMTHSFVAVINNCD